MKFRKYQKLERFGMTSVENIEIGNCVIFPKIDGTNASVWLDNGEIKAKLKDDDIKIVNES